MNEYETQRLEEYLWVGPVGEGEGGERREERGERREERGESSDDGIAQGWKTARLSVTVLFFEISQMAGEMVGRTDRTVKKKLFLFCLFFLLFFLFFLAHSQNLLLEITCSGLN